MPKIFKGICKVCNKEYKGRGRLFCSRSCTRTFLNKENNPSKHPIARLKISQSRKGISTGSNEKHWNWQGIKNKKIYCIDCGIALKGIRWGKKQHIKYCVNCRVKGKRSVHWKGGVTPQRIIECRKLKYKEFIKLVLMRDKYICQLCGVKTTTGKKVKLEVHHIKSYAEHIDLRYDISNVITLCRPCHINTMRKPTRRKILEFNIK